MIDLQTYLLYFFLYAFLGWCTEVVYAAVTHGKFINRGFLNGPICPIYGFGVVTVLLVLTPLKEHFLLLFLGSVLLTSALELVTGFLLDRLFHHKWWDYSNNPLNIGGYVCLKFSLAWGLACVLVVDVVHPALAALIDFIPRGLVPFLIALFSAAFLADAAVTVANVLKLNKRLEQLEEVGRALHRLSDAIGENVAGRAMAAEAAAGQAKIDLAAEKQALIQRREELISKFSKEHRRILAAFPDLKSRRHGDLLQSIKDRFRR